MSAVWFLLGFGAASLGWSIVLGLIAASKFREEAEERWWYGKRSPK